MKTTSIGLCALLGVAVVASGQTTKPSELDDLRRINKGLQSQIAELKQDVATLTARLKTVETEKAALEKKLPSTTQREASIDDTFKQLWEGQTKAKVLEIMKRSPDREDISDSGTKIRWKWNFTSDVDPKQNGSIVVVLTFDYVTSTEKSKG